MDLQLSGKRALVTGSTKGLGAAVARCLGAEGASVVVHGRDAQQAELVARSIIDGGGEAAVALGELTDDDQADRVATASLDAFGGIDVLVNCAGGYFERPWAEAGATEWVALYDQNVGSQVRLIRRLIPGMRERGWGRVIAIGSAGGYNPLPELAAYCASKAAIVNLAVALAKELAGTGVTSNCVTPGTMLTEGVLEFARAAARARGWPMDWELMEKQFTDAYASNPTGRIGRVEDVAAFVALIASPLAAYVNGANLRMEGGFTPSVN